MKKQQKNQKKSQSSQQQEKQELQEVKKQGQSNYKKSIFQILGLSKKDTGSYDVEVDQSHVGVRVAIFVVALACAIGGFAYGISQLLSKDPGWTAVTVNTSSLNCGDDFTFLYDIGEGELSASKELKNLRSLYSEVCVEAYEVFDTTAEYEDCLNMWYLLNHVNEKVEVAPLLYQSLAKVEESGTRYLYTGTMSALYSSLTYSRSDIEAESYDPYRNEDLKEFYAELALYICDPDSIHIEFFDNNQVMLYVSDEYMAFAEENSVTEWIDFSWMKNAFITDYIVETMMENGYDLGLVMSNDGYIRGFDVSDSSNATFPIYHREDNTVSVLTAMYCSGTDSYVYYRDYPLEDEPEGRYYMYQDAEFRYRYIDPEDGLCKAALTEMVFCAEDMTCTDLMLATAPFFIADSFDEDGVWDLADQQEIVTLYYGDDELNIVQAD